MEAAHKIPKDEKWNENNFILYFGGARRFSFAFLASPII